MLADLIIIFFAGALGVLVLGLVAIFWLNHKHEQECGFGEDVEPHDGPTVRSVESPTKKVIYTVGA